MNKTRPTGRLWLLIFCTGLSCLTARSQYTLTDEDVVVINGYIDTCLIELNDVDLIIPGTLDGQSVTGIADKPEHGVFAGMTIQSIDLPSGLEHIGKRAFSGNSITDLDLGGFTSLQYIGDKAFEGAGLETLLFTGCDSLLYIGHDAFRDNDIASLDLSPCTGLVFIGSCAFLGNYATVFILPVHAAYGAEGWMDSHGYLHAAGSEAFDQSLFYAVPVPYTLTDDDVDVQEGIIQSCSYDYVFKYIIIPDTLDGQVVKGIADKGETEFGVFEMQSLIRVDLPSTIQFIGDRAFRANKLADLDLSACTELKRIGKSAFRGGNIRILDLSCCPMIETIDSMAFESNELVSLDFSNCSQLIIIDSRAFSLNDLTELDLSPCTSLEEIRPAAFHYNCLVGINFSNCERLAVIREMAFADNPLATLDLSPCTALIYIGTRAFGYGTLKEFALPTPDIPGYNFNFWKDEYGQIYSGGDTVTNMTPVYTADLTWIGFIVDFIVSDGSDPLEAAEVLLEGCGTQMTDETGMARFTSLDPVEDLAYLVAAAGYDTVVGSITITDNDIVEEVIMSLLSYRLTFVITDGSQAVPDANVELEGYGSRTTDASGEAVFDEVYPEANLAYTVSAEGFLSLSGTLNIDDSDVTEHLTLTYDGIARPPETELLIYPNPTTGMLRFRLGEPALVSIINPAGIAVYQEEMNREENSLDISSLPQGNYIVLVQLADRVIARRICVE